MGKHDFVGIQRLLGRRRAGVSPGNKTLCVAPSEWVERPGRKAPKGGYQNSGEHKRAMSFLFVCFLFFLKKSDLGSAQRKSPTAVHEQLNSVLKKNYNDNLPITLPFKVE